MKKFFQKIIAWFRRLGRKFNVKFCREWCKQQFPCKACKGDDESCDCPNLTNDRCCAARQNEYLKGEGDRYDIQTNR